VTAWDSMSSAAKGADVTEFSKDQLDKVRGRLEQSGVKPQCPACGRGTMVVSRAPVGILEVAHLQENPTAALGGEAGRTGRIATCVLFACNTCGYVRLHSLAALDLDGMM
jgi:hypothetical protein